VQKTLVDNMLGLWVLEEDPPNYQEFQSKDVPKAKKDGVLIVVIAGESLGVKSLVFIYAPILICIWISPCNQVLSFIN
jgi:redox-sensitive bicupin YhaK (pirin superfamily)